MGRVKELWQEEREKKFQEYYEKYRTLGYTDEEAAEMSSHDLDAEDEANGQFGAGA